LESKVAHAIALGSSPVAVVLTDERPPEAVQFKEDRWGCVGQMIVAVSKGRTAVFDRTSFGCPGGGTGLGFGNAYQKTGFAIDCLLSGGDEEIAAGMTRRSRMGEGERFFKSRELAERAIASMPMREVPTEYVVFKPLELAEGGEPTLVIFLVNPDQLSALVVLAGYEHGRAENAIAPFGAACHSILYGYAEAEKDEPRGVIGFFDIAQRARVPRDVLSFTVPFALFREMEGNVSGSFLEMEDWRELRERQ